MKSGILREDLFYALNALRIPLPPLCNRSGDIPALSDHFIGLRDPSSPTRFTTAALDALQAYEWPGNVRELRHVVECAMELTNGGPVYPSHLPTHIAHRATTTSSAPGELKIAITRWLDERLEPADATAPAYDALLDEIEAMMLSHLLDRHEQRPTRLASAHRIHRATLRQKLRRMGLRSDES
jgi:DNA-binding NtrC family response regulator